MMTNFIFHESLKNTKIVFDERFAQKELAFFVRIANGVLIAIMVLFKKSEIGGWGMAFDQKVVKVFLEKQLQLF